MKDYRVDVKVRNNRILSKILEAGFSSVGAFCAAKKLQPSAVGQLVNMRTPALIGAKTGKPKFSKLVFDLATALNCSPEDLFNEQQIDGLASNMRSIEISSEQLFTLSHQRETDPEAHLENQLLLEEVTDVVHNELTEREEKLINMRFGLAGQPEHTLKQIADEFGVGTERIRQIECKALRKLRCGNLKNPVLRQHAGFIEHDREAERTPQNDLLNLLRDSGFSTTGLCTQDHKDLCDLANVVLPVDGKWVCDWVSEMHLTAITRLSNFLVTEFLRRK